MQKKKILYVITKSNWGGAQKYVYDLAANLPKEQFEVAVALGGTGALKEKLESAGLRVINVRGLERDLRMNELAVFGRLYRIFKTEKPDVVHLNSSKIGGLGAFAARLARVPKIIFTAHGWAFQEEWRSAAQKKILRVLSFVTVMLSHRTIVISHSQYRQTPREFFFGSKITTIHNGITPIQFLERREARKLLPPLPDPHSGQLWIGTIGELHKNKGHAYAIEAIRELVQKKKDILFVIIGEGEERAALESLIAGRTLEDRVILAGHRSDAASYLSAFDIFLFPSTKEGHPYALLEAGAAGLAVVATSVGGIPDIIENMQSGILVPPKNPEELARALELLIEHPDKRREFGEALRERVQKEFSLDRMVQETTHLYKESS